MSGITLSLGGFSSWAAASWDFSGRGERRQVAVTVGYSFRNEKAKETRPGGAKSESGAAPVRDPKSLSRGASGRCGRDQLGQEAAGVARRHGRHLLGRAFGDDAARGGGALRHTVDLTCRG